MTSTYDAPETVAVDTALRMVGINKTYPGVVALDDVSFEVRRGEVHAIVGENGAGKSTLIGVAAGSVAADSGLVEIGGNVVDGDDPRAAQASGLAVVYQHPALLPDLTVAENMALATPKDKRPPIYRTVAWARDILAGLDVDVDPRRRGKDLSVAERHLVEIARALASDPTVLILDEPTEPLDAEEVERLFARVRAIAAQGTAVVYISHRLPEVLSIADRLTVLRDGAVRGTHEVADVSEQQIVNLIVGRDLSASFLERTSRRPGDPVLRLVDFSSPGHLDGVTLELAHGEIVGLGGIAGNGQDEFLRALAGHSRTAGELYINDRRARPTSPHRAARAGIVYTSGDRQEEGIFSELDVRENMTIGALDEFAAAGLVSKRKENRAARELIDDFGIRTPGTTAALTSLSGGNQQKVLLARALLRKPKVLLIQEPTAGVDVGARQEIYRVLRELADRGVVVIINSSDVTELEGICDRVLVFSRGRIIENLSGPELSEESITSAALTSTHLRSDETAGRFGGMRRFLSGDYVPSAALIAVIIGVGIYTSTKNDRFLLSTNISDMLFAVSTMAFLAMAQQLVMIVGGIDLSVGPLVGLLVIIASFRLGPGAGTGALIVTVLLMVVIGAGVGAVNGSFVRYLKMSSVVATLVSFTVLQGISLILRPTADGRIDDTIVSSIGSLIGGVVPVMFVVAAVCAVALEVMLRWTSLGVALRAVGSREETAAKLGVKTERLRLLSFVAAGLFVALGAVVLMAQIGIGDPTVGTPFTLASITAVVLGGGSIFGARGSFIGAVFGGLLLQEVTKATVFLDAGAAWQYWLVGLLALAAAGLYSRLRLSL